MAVLAMSGVLALLVVAIVVVAALKNDNPKTDPVANPGSNTSAGGSNGADPKAPAAIDECLVGTWVTTSHTELVPMQGIGDVPFKLDKNGWEAKFSRDGKATLTYTNSTLSGDPEVQGTKTHVTLTVNATVTADVHTAGGSIAWTDLKSDGKATLSAPSLGINTTTDFTASDDPSKYTCVGHQLDVTTNRFHSILNRTSSTG
ncbi:hypothetical protein [Dactylosporangium darangshiense]|uniref:hypothetical protein n=1 Tax=Dactylosporangium darangshiense TaxID=579108 RepID=UPI00362CA500